MSAFELQRLFALFLLIGASQAGLLHRRNAKENALKDQIPVTIVLDSDLKPEQPLPLITDAPAPVIATAAPELDLPKAELKPATNTDELLSPNLQTEIPAETQPQSLKKLPENSEQKEILSQNVEPVQQLLSTDAIVEAQQQNADAVITDEKSQQATTQAESTDDALTTIAVAAADNEATLPIKESLDLPQPQPEAILVDEISAASASLEESTGLKALPEAIASEIAAQNVAHDQPADDLERQATQATPTQSSTQQNFVQQLIQNSPIGQFLSQFTGGLQQQQQQQQQNQQADQPATPQPTLPGFLNPAAAITSAQQVVQNAAQSVVNSTTQAFQGLQQFATNLGTQFQNTFSNLAGQQNQLTTADSTTTRPPGPIQQIVSNFIGGGNNATAAAGQQPGPLQGLFQGLFQGGNRPQGTTAPPKEVEPAAVKPTTVDDKLETKPQNDEIIAEPQEPDSINEVRTSAEVISEDTSLEDVPAEELIVVNDDATQQQDVSV